MKKSILLISALILVFLSTYAQQVYKSGGTSNSTFLFGYASYAAKSQCIFLPSELTNAQSGSIIRLYYRYGTTGITSPQTLTNFEISIGQTTATSYVADSTFFTGLTQVLSVPSYIIPAGTSGSWFSIDLSNTFAYDVSKTLIIQLRFTASAVNNWGTYGTSNSPIRKIISGDVNAVYGDPTSATWQDMGFDLGPVSVGSVPAASIAIDVFPNPANDKLMVGFTGSQKQNNIQVSLVNNIGELIVKKNCRSTGNMLFDVTDLPRGIYFLKAELENGDVVKKVVLE